MPFTAAVFAPKIVKLREDRGLAVGDAVRATGIALERFRELEAGTSTPTGDEVLVLADTYLSDFTWLIEDTALNPDENLETLFRIEGGKLSPTDKRATAEFLHLCKAETLLASLLTRPKNQPLFAFSPKTTNHVQQGIQYATAFREAIGLPKNALIPNLYEWLRGRGFHVFRRPLGKSAISGLLIRHNDLGSCILINSSEDQYRQRFSAAHEIGHALIDTDKVFNVSTPADERGDANYVEMRASSFASAFLMPTEYLLERGTSEQWKKPEKIVEEADRLWVTVPALLSALKRARLIDDATRQDLKEKNLRLPEKRDPELAVDLTSRQYERRRSLMSRGLHASYVQDCFEAYNKGEISLGKVGEILLVEPSEVPAIAADLGIHIEHA